MQQKGKGKRKLARGSEKNGKGLGKCQLDVPKGDKRKKGMLGRLSGALGAKMQSTEGDEGELCSGETPFWGLSTIRRLWEIWGGRAMKRKQKTH